jgi:hypothetical protein
MKTCGGVDVYIYPRILDLGNTLRRMDRLPPPPGGGGSPQRSCIGGWVGLRIGLDDVGKRTVLTLSGLELRPLGRPAHSQSLCQLLYDDGSITSL